MTRKRFKKLYYSWIIKNRDSFENLGKTLKNVRKVEIVKPNFHVYQLAWNYLNKGNSNYE